MSLPNVTGLNQPSCLTDDTRSRSTAATGPSRPQAVRPPPFPASTGQVDAVRYGWRQSHCVRRCMTPAIQTCSSDVRHDLASITSTAATACMPVSGGAHSGQLQPATTTREHHRRLVVQPALRGMVAGGQRQRQPWEGLTAGEQDARVPGVRPLGTIHWSSGQRTNVENARAAESISRSSAEMASGRRGGKTALHDGRRIARWSATRTHANAKIDPLPNSDRRARPAKQPTADGRLRKCAGGPIFMVNGGRSDAITVPAADGKMRFWRIRPSLIFRRVNP